MKSKDLKSPFSWKERKPCLQDQVFYVPDYFESHAAYSFSWEFEKEQPVCIEYCSGNGEWVIDMAQRHPEKNWIAVELRFDRVRQIWANMKKKRLTNLLVVCGEAWTFTHFYLSQASIEAIYINFPDPWPKRRHQKHRLVKPSFLDEIARVLKKDKSIYLVTDDSAYLDATIKCFQQHTCFQAELAMPYYTQCSADYGSSWFHTLWKSLGREIYYTLFQKKRSYGKN